MRRWRCHDLARHFGLQSGRQADKCKDEVIAV